MDDYPDDLRLLYFEFGRASETAQVMELEAGNFALAFASLAFDPSKLTDEQRGLFRAVVDDVNTRTFGNLVRQIRRIASIDESIEKAIAEGLDKRNYLVHRFFPTHNIQINSEAGRREMISELKEIHESLTRAHRVLLGMTHTLNQAFGRPNISQERALELLRLGKKLEI